MIDEEQILNVMMYFERIKYLLRNIRWGRELFVVSSLNHEYIPLKVVELVKGITSRYKRKLSYFPKAFARKFNLELSRDIFSIDFLSVYDEEHGEYLGNISLLLYPSSHLLREDIRMLRKLDMSWANYISFVFEKLNARKIANLVALTLSSENIEKIGTEIIRRELEQPQHVYAYIDCVNLFLNWNLISNILSTVGREIMNVIQRKVKSVSFVQSDFLERVNVFLRALKLLS